MAEDGPLKGQCRAPHVMVDCEAHGHLAKVHEEATGRLIMAGHLDRPDWPPSLEPADSAGVRARIDASRTNKGQIFVPSTYKG
jgi:hypothetical protein